LQTDRQDNGPVAFGGPNGRPKIVLQLQSYRTIHGGVRPFLEATEENILCSMHLSYARCSDSDVLVMHKK